MGIAGIVTALTLAALAALAAPAPAACAVATAGNGDSEDFPCNLSAAHPLLDAATYTRYRFEQQANDRSIEYAQIAPGVRLELATSGCVDSVARTYTFIFGASSSTARSNADWAARVAPLLAGLRFKPDYSRSASALGEFLARVPQLQPHEGIARLCADESAPVADDCSWQSGGEYRFERIQGRAEVRIVLLQNTSA